MSVQLRAEMADGMPSAERAKDFAPLQVTIHRDFASIDADWRNFEQRAIATPYQHFDWSQAYSETLGHAHGETPLIAVVKNASGSPVMLLPLAIRRRGGLTVATFIGGRQANFHMPLFDPMATAGRDAATWRSILQDIARAAGIDVFSFVNQPLAWQGTANPLVTLGGWPSPSPGFKRQLNFPADQTFAVLLGPESRKKMRKKERRLKDISPVAYRRVEDPVEIERVLQTFLEQKGARFRQKHITNPFEDPAAIEFLRRGSRIGADGKTAIELYALFMGDAILATFGGTCDGERFCGMFNSFSMEAEVAKSSPGDLLLLNLIETQCRRGVATFDLGVGAAAYKLAVCGETEPLVDIYLPISTRGRIYAGLDHLGRAAKGWAKSTPWVVAAVERLRRLRR
ncbi:GNAT family N-acetyltransferase [Chelatococcus sp. GCM10030263]|uniref:GNAT family N-acetyltransferase n=1 Tax=Chelatococcus sp. GCM10030263 TaxID=3273387 RepID=UPI00360CAAE8